MTDRLLRFFVAVYEEKNLTRASEKCFVSQPNISNGLKQLEEQLGKQLFVRSKRGVSLKEEAHYLYPIAKRILNELNALPDLFEQEIYKQKVSIGIAEGLSAEMKCDFFRKASSLDPAVEWDVRQMSRDCELNLLVREWKYEEDLFLPVWKDEYVLCVPDGNQLQDRERISFQDLKEQPFIHCPPCEAHQQTLSMLNDAGAKWNTAANCSTKTEVLSLLMAGLGITFLPESLVKHKQGFQIKAYDGPKNYREIGLSYARESLRNEAVKRLVQIFSEE
ncbi:MAG: LysR family transcriptional regulator [Cytophagales bacterium]|nr:LysR family transcriptional regulator [Cytophagales bacterium]